MPSYRFLQWIDINKLDMYRISNDPRAVSFFRENKNKIDWLGISYNSGAIDIIKENIHQINWKALSLNPAAIPILNENIDKINWDNFLRIEEIAALPVIQNNKNKITDWTFLCQNHSVWINDIFDENIIKSLDYRGLLFLSENPYAIPTIEKFINSVEWAGLSRNPNALHLLRKEPSKIEMWYLLDNPNPDALALYEQYIDILPKRIHTLELSNSYTMVPYLKKNLKYLDSNIFTNQNPEAFELIKHLMDELLAIYGEFYYWKELSGNPVAIDILKQNIDHIDWEAFCELEEAIPIIENHIDKVNWSALSSNPKAIHILQKHPDKIDYDKLSLNDAIYEEVIF
jgi:hypothetical protein